MRVELFVISTTLAIFSCDVVLADPKWPPLPTHGFIKGHVAHKEDVARGNASFVLDANGMVVGRPLKIAIPQYGCFKKPKTPVMSFKQKSVPTA